MPDVKGNPLQYDYLRGPEGVHEILSVLPKYHDDYWEVTIMVGNLVCHVRATEFRAGLWDASDLAGNPYERAVREVSPRRRPSERADALTMIMFPELHQGLTRMEPRPMIRPPRSRLIPYMSLSYSVIVAFALGLALVLWAIPALLRWL